MGWALRCAAIGRSPPARRGRAPRFPVIGRAANAGGFQPGWPHGAQLRELAGLSLHGAALLSPSSAGGLRVATAAPAAEVKAGADPRLSGQRGSR